MASGTCGEYRGGDMGGKKTGGQEFNVPWSLPVVTAPSTGPQLRMGDGHLRAPAPGSAVTAMPAPTTLPSSSPFLPS